MTQGEGLIGLLYALKGLLEAGVIWIVAGAGMLAFFWIIFQYIAGKAGLGGHGGHGPWGGGHDVGGKNIVWGLVILFVIFSIYSLIALTGAVFGVNSGPAGGLIIR